MLYTEWVDMIGELNGEDAKRLILDMRREREKEEVAYADRTRI